jgi:hypothetical protein
LKNVCFMPRREKRKIEYFGGGLDTNLQKEIYESMPNTHWRVNI